MVLRKILPATSPPPRGRMGNTTHYDYYGLSQQTAAVRNTPWRLIGKSWEYQGDDPILSSFTHGPTGISARTDEGGDTVMEYDVQYDVLPDLFGGTTGVMTEGNQTLIPGFQHFDAFGVRLTDAASGASLYHWRGQESSETAEYDAGTHPAGNGRYGVSLIYMQTRDYDPETGRFLAPDALYVSSLTTQGMNRYIYCNNDPVNYSDPTGSFMQLMFGIGVAIGLGIGATVGWNGVMGTPLNVGDALSGGAIGLLGTLALDGVMWGCFNWQSAYFSGLSALFGALLAASLLGAIAMLGLAGLALLGGILVGFAIGLGIGAVGAASQQFLGWLYRNAKSWLASANDNERSDFHADCVPDSQSDYPFGLLALGCPVLVQWRPRDFYGAFVLHGSKRASVRYAYWFSCSPAHQIQTT